MPSLPPGSWPQIDPSAIGPTVAHLHRLAHMAGKYTLFQPYEPYWAGITLDVTPRGLSTRTIQSGPTIFDIEINIFDSLMRLRTSDGGRVEIPIIERSIADAFVDLTSAMVDHGLPVLPSKLETEIENGVPYDEDAEVRPWEVGAALTWWRAIASAYRVMAAWQAPYLGHRTALGVYWGGFDLFAGRFRGSHQPPPANQPPWAARGRMADEVGVGLFLSADTPMFFAYIRPEPADSPTARLVPESAQWSSSLSEFILPYEDVRSTKDPDVTLMGFLDSLWEFAVASGWSADLAGERRDGWWASRTPPG